MKTTNALLSKIRPSSTCASARKQLGATAALALAMSMSSVFTVKAQTSVWNLNLNGDYGTAANWTPNVVPNAIGATASITANITGTRTITLDIDPTIGTLILGDTNNTNSYTIGATPGAGTITFNNGGAGALLNHNSATAGISPSNSDIINANVALADAGGLVIDADRNIEFRGAWTGGGNSITMPNSGRVYFNAGSAVNFGTLSNVSNLNILNGETRFDGLAGGAIDQQVIGATTINLGDGLVTTGGAGFRVFPRLFLVNTESTQTATLNLNGGWLTSDLGNNDAQVIWSGPINVTGLATTNIIDVNDAGAPDTHIVSGVISGSGGFSKINSGTLALTANNTLLGNVFIQRGGAGGASLTASEGGIQLQGAAGALSAVNSVILSRDGSLYIDNSGAINTDRFNNAGGVTLRGSGRLRMIGNAGGAVSESFGALFQETGSGKINFDIDNTTPSAISLTFASYTRAAGSITQFQVLDNTVGAFGSPTGGNAQLFIADSGATALIKGGGGANGTTNKSLVVGAFGGVNNISNQFMTFDSVNTTELRPLIFTGVQATSEYLLTRTLSTPHTLTQATLGTLDQNVLINYNVDFDGDVDFYANRPVTVLENIGMNSLRFGTNTPISTTNTLNNNEIGSALVIKAGARVYLGDSLAANTGLSGNTDGSGMILFGRDVTGTSPGSNQYIAGGVLDFGSREAIIVNESGNSAFIRSNITGTGGLTKAGAQSVYLDNSNSYTGDTNIAEGLLYVRDQNALGGSTLVRIEGSGQLILELGTNVLNSTISATPPDLFVGVNDASRVVLSSNNSNNTWGGNVIIDTVDNLGNWVFTAQLGTGALATLNINGDIYGNELLNPISTDTALNDARLISTQGVSLAGGIINLNGQFRDNSGGAVTAPVTINNENQVLRFQMRGSNELIVNARQQWDAAGKILIENGLLRYEGEGNFYSADAASKISAANAQSGLRLGGSGSGTGISGANNNTANVGFILTEAGQALNISRIDIGGDGTSNFNGLGNTMLAGTNTSGTVTFGDGTGTVNYTGSNLTNAFIRDLTVYQAGGGTMNLNFRLDDTDADSLTSLTKIGRGVVNYNSATTTNGDVEMINLSGGLLRLTGYGTATGTRFDIGAKLILAGGGIEMDTTGAIAAETENYTTAALIGYTGTIPAQETLVAPGGTDVIVTSGGFNATMNIGSATTGINRQSGGTVNFVENVAGAGAASITLLGNGGAIQANDTAYAWATYGNSFVYNAGLATYTVNALDFAATTGAGGIGQFNGPTRQNEDNVALWTPGMDVSENVAGYSGAAAAAVNTIHFDVDAVGSIDATSGLVVTSGGIMVSSTVATATSNKSIVNGTLSAGADADLILHQYGAAPLTISSTIQNNAGSGAAGNALVKTGPGTVILSGTNTYTGKTFLNGGTLSISNEVNLGPVPAAALADAIYMNGGTLATSGDVTFSANRGITLGGNGGEVNVAPGTTLTVGGVIASEPNLTPGYAANPAVGRIDKSGTGTLVYTQLNNTYAGLTDITAGTLKWETAQAGAASGTRTPFGTNNAFLDGTTVRSGATLELAARSLVNTGTALTQTLQEWFTFEGGSTLNISLINTVADPHNTSYNLRGVLRFDSLGNAGTLDGTQTAATLAGATTINVARQTVNLNDAGGYITGDGGITKIGAGTLAFRENNPEWTGQLIVTEGVVDVFSAGSPLGVGTAPIILGRNAAAQAAGEPTTTGTTVQLTYRDEGFYRDVSTITQNIIVRDDTGTANQTKRVGARLLADVDVVNYAGSLTLQDDVEFFYQDDARDSTAQAGSTGNTRNDSRAIGALTNSETVFINFNGNIVGTAGNDITTNVVQAGNGNVLNGSITGANDDLVVRAIFGLNGDNSAWMGNLLIGNNTTGAASASDVDTIHIVSIGNSAGISANNDVLMRNDSILQTSGTAVTIGNLTTVNTTANVALKPATNVFIENASTTAGSVTVTQTTSAAVGAVLRNGQNFFQLQPGESDAALSFTKAGAADLTLTADSTYTGATTVDEGALLVTGMLSGTVSVDVQSGGTLGGTGSINVAATVTVVSGGTIAPGLPTPVGVGTLSSGALSLTGSSTFALEINTGAGTNDVLNAAGSLSLDNANTVVLAITDLGSTPVPLGTSFAFLNYNGTRNAGLFNVNGTPIDDYDAITNPNSAFFTVGANSFQIDYDFGGNSVALLTAVPEPGALTSLLGGLGMLVGLQRFRRPARRQGA